MHWNTTLSLSHIGTLLTEQGSTEFNSDRDETDLLYIDLQREIVNLRRLCSERGCSEDEIAICKPRRRSKSFRSELQKLS